MFKQDSMARILVTGFEPFSNHSRNISGDVISKLEEVISIIDPWKKHRDYNLDEIQVIIETEVLSVDKKGTILVSNKLSKGEKWDGIIQLGLCETCELPRIELTARNLLDMRIEDNSGRRIRGQNLGDIDLQTTIDDRILMPNDLEIKSEISYDAGTFICNETYYKTLAMIYQKESEVEHRTPCLFVHLPGYEIFSVQETRDLMVNLIGRILFKPVIPVAAGVLLDEGRMLVAKRNDETYLGQWEFPGGKFEFGETASQAIERELKEEFNWQVKSVRNFGNWFHRDEKYDIELNVQICRFVGKIPSINAKFEWTSHDELRWIRLGTEVSPYVGIDDIVAKEVSKMLLDPGSGIA